MVSSKTPKPQNPKTPAVTVLFVKMRYVNTVKLNTRHACLERNSSSSDGDIGLEFRESLLEESLLCFASFLDLCLYLLISYLVKAFLLSVLRF